MSVAAAATVGVAEAGECDGEAFVPADGSEAGVAGVERGDVCGVEGGEFFDEASVPPPAVGDDADGHVVPDGHPFHP